MLMYFAVVTIWVFCVLKLQSLTVTNLQVHHGGAGTTATGLRAGVIFFSIFFSLICLRYLSS